MIRSALRTAFAWKKLYTAASLLACVAGAQAAGGPKPDFAVTIGPAVLCRSKMDLKFYYDYLTASFGPSTRRDQGAYWFNAKAQLFEQQVKEIFVGDQHGDWIFVGVVFKSKPDDLAKAVKTSAGTIFIKTDSGYQYSPYNSQGMSEIMWQNTDSKLFCRHFVGEAQQ
jgi:hypothetical protein